MRYIRDNSRGCVIMPKVYYNLIKKGRKTIDDVPEQDRAEVQALLDSDE